MSTSPTPVTGLGAVTPVGLSLAATCAALRAGISRMVAIEGWNDHGEPPPADLVGGRVPMEWLRGDVRTEWPGHERMDVLLPAPHRLLTPDAERLVELALPAAAEAWRDAGSPEGRVGLYLGLDEGDDGRDLAAALGESLRVGFQLQRADRLGRAAALAAVHRALRHLREDRVDIALVGGVDSQLRRSALARMTAAGTLRSDANPTGVIPGEAAAFLVLEQRVQGRRTRAWLEASAVAEEPTAGSEEPNKGQGLTQALRGARAEAKAHDQRPLIVCDLNGERYRTIEWSLANVRALGDLHGEPGVSYNLSLWHPADCIGDTGAASGALSLAWAAEAMRRGYAPATRSLVWGASDGPLRACVLLARERER